MAVCRWIASIDFLKPPAQPAASLIGEVLCGPQYSLVVTDDSTSPVYPVRSSFNHFIPVGMEASFLVSFIGYFPVREQN